MLTSRAERVATISAHIGVIVDKAVTAHITAGTPLPPPASIRSLLVHVIRVGTVDVLDDIDDTRPRPDMRMVDRETRALVATLMVVVNRAFRDARNRRRQLERVDVEDDSSSTVPVVVFAVAVLRRLRRPGVVGLDQVKADAVRAGVPMPPKVGPKIRQIVRTELAISRNKLAADIADSTGRLLFVTDGGPCNYKCETFHRKWATPAWVRRNPTSHPNCVRECRPAVLPAGVSVDFT